MKIWVNLDKKQKKVTTLFMLACDPIWLPMLTRIFRQLSCDCNVMVEHLFICFVNKISVIFIFIMPFFQNKDYWLIFFSSHTTHQIVLAQWRNTINFLSDLSIKKKNPWLGWGITYFSNYFNQFQHRLPTCTYPELRFTGVCQEV